MKPEIKIENWFVVGKRLHGEIEYHSELGDCRGGLVTTSQIEKIETKNSIYILGEYGPPDKTKMVLGEDTHIQTTSPKEQE